MSQFYYILEANVYLLLFFAFYKLLLQRETFHKLNRFYLLTVSVLSFLLPCLQWNILPPEATNSANGYLRPVVDLSQSGVPRLLDFTGFAIVLYLVLSAYFLTKFGARVFKIAMLIKKSEVKRWNGTLRIDLNNNGTAFSFLNYLFIDPKLPALETVIAHELVHIRQRHTIDVLFFELIHAFNWFNPIIPVIKKEIKSLHEFLADEQAILSEKDAESYSLFLIQHSFGKLGYMLTSQIFSTSLLKRRIQRVFMERSRPVLRLKYLSLLPLSIIFLLFSSMIFPKTYSLLIFNETEKVSIILAVKPTVSQSNDSAKNLKTPANVQPAGRISRNKPVFVSIRKPAVDTTKKTMLEITILPTVSVDTSKLKENLN